MAFTYHPLAAGTNAVTRSSRASLAPRQSRPRALRTPVAAVSDSSPSASPVTRLAHAALAGSRNVLSGVAIAATVATNAALADVPFDAPPPTPFYDDSGIVPKGQIGYLDRGLEKLRETTGFDVHFLTVRSFPYDETPNQYAQELFEQWKLGDKDVVIVGGTKVARAGLAVGKDAAPLLTDEVIESIGSRTFEAKAAQESYGSASLDVMNRVIPILNGQPDPGPPAQQLDFAESTFKSKEETKEQRGKYTKVVGFLLIVAFVVPMLQYWWYVKDS